MTVNDAETLVRMIYNVPIGSGGASLSFETSFFRDASPKQIIEVVEKLEDVAARQVAKGQLQALEDNSVRLEAQHKIAEDSLGRLQALAEERLRPDVAVPRPERAKIASDLDVAKANVAHLGRERDLLEAKLASIRAYLEAP